MSKYFKLGNIYFYSLKNMHSVHLLSENEVIQFYIQHTILCASIVVIWLAI